MVGRDLASTRKSLGLTQRQLAELVGVDPITISRWERGVRTPRGVHARLLAQALSQVPEPGVAEETAA